MADLRGGQLTIDGTTGDFDIVTDAWHPIEDALTPLWFGNDLEGEDTRVGGGDWVLNPKYWKPTVVQIPMWFMGHIDRAGTPYEVPMEGLEANLSTWRTEILDPTVVARAATLTMPSGEQRTNTISRLQLTGTGRRRPTGWPLTFQFLITRPFAPEGS